MDLPIRADSFAGPAGPSARPALLPEIVNAPNEPPSPFRFRHPVAVRFRDVDVAGHAHHADALIYFEEGRWAYWRHVVGEDRLDDLGYVMAEGRVSWHARVLWPQTVSVGVRVSRVGTKSFGMEYEVRGEDGTLLQSGSTVQVMYDYSADSSVPVPDGLRARLEAFDGPFEDV